MGKVGQRLLYISDIGNKEDLKPIVVLFVGCLAKHLQGS
jgi:hypothetical protein